MFLYSGGGLGGLVKIRKKEEGYGVIYFFFVTLRFW